MDFNFELTLSADGFYGFLDKNGQWNGMIGDLVSDRAHIAAAPLTITAVRERVVDFTQPFMTLGIAVMHKKSGIEGGNGNVKDFKSVEELVSQNRVDYGCNYGSATQQFFVNSENQLHKTMLSHMSSNDGKSYVRDSREGMERVMKGDYAFMTESTAIEYAIARECDLYQIGGLLNNKGFGFAVKKQDKGHLRTALSSAILELQERGVLEKLKAKYWQAEQDC
ncbi:Glutamate receptor ionotropic, kainate 1 [Pseudolycoriella hygida]|uniref:Glutamate receptor ionotropic, kainate 1 n=1 Tax=Pseudolycoriella hygida TaxID=35572 RepID=A0A9Q0S6U0_9DIPT|nr:Glutamate receptor ionotropic, kainate 1 [Pseudolycoriella hygida]